MEETHWFLIKNPQFKHLNLCMNQIDEFVTPAIESCFQYTPDDFCLTLSGNQIPKEHIDLFHKLIKQVHKDRLRERRLSEPGIVVTEIADLPLRRCAV